MNDSRDPDTGHGLLCARLRPAVLWGGRALRAASCSALLGALSACAPEVGSERWCEQMREKPRGDWTVNEGLEFARHCLFESEE